MQKVHIMDSSEGSYDLQKKINRNIELLTEGYNCKIIDVKFSLSNGGAYSTTIYGAMIIYETNNNDYIILE